MAWAGGTTVSPLKRIRRARGFTMNQIVVFAGVSMESLRRVDRLESGDIHMIRIGTLMRIAMLLECAPADLIPILSHRYKKRKKSVERD